MRRGNALREEPRFIEPLTPAQEAKAAGLKNLSHVAELTGQSLQTLINWHRSKPELFEVVLLGCKAKHEADLMTRGTESI